MNRTSAQNSYSSKKKVILLLLDTFILYKDLMKQKGKCFD